ncbi:Outer membrane efflux protein [Methylococcus capsulatus]|nr:TolC family protein [Methylococcus capsulatus]CAI8861163.1 Outer membrane efflux protein [Methylococcus capsulatus]
MCERLLLGGPDMIGLPRGESRVGSGAVPLILTLTACLVCGCADYRSRPLDQDELVGQLAVPAPGSLAEAASRLRHPRLRPVSLDFSKPLTDEALGILAVLVSPELKAFRAKEAVAEAQVFNAGLLPDPKLFGRFDWVFSGPAGLVSPYTATLQWDLAKLATRSTDLHIAEEHARQVRLDVAWQEWLVANQARLLARRCAYLARQEAVAAEAAQISAQLLELSRHNLALGDATLAELGIREAAFLDAKDRSLALARQIAKARQDLNRLLGFPPAQRLVIADVEAKPPAGLDPERLFVSARRQRLDLQALEAGYASQEASVYRAILGQYPAFTLGINDYHYYSDYNTGGPTVSLDLPLFNRNRGAIAIAEATREQLYREYLGRLNQTRADIGTLVTDLDRIAQEREPLARELPELIRAERLLREAAAVGDATLVNYETVRANYLDKRLKLLALEQAAAEQAVALQLAVGSASIL